MRIGVVGAGGVGSAFGGRLAHAGAGMTACTRLPIGDIRAVPATWDMFTNIVDEVVALGSAEGVDLPSDTEQKIARFAQALPAGSYSSLHDDPGGGRRLELQAWKY